MLQMRAHILSLGSLTAYSALIPPNSLNRKNPTDTLKESKQASQQTQIT